MVERQLPKLHTGVRFPSPAIFLRSPDVPKGLEKVAAPTLGPHSIPFLNVRQEGPDCILNFDLDLLREEFTAHWFEEKMRPRMVLRAFGPW